MNVNVKLSLTDDERKQLARFIDKKISKRLATRKDVNEFVQGCLAAALQRQGVIPVMLDNDDAEIARLKEAGHSDSYIRGWMKVKNKQFANS